MQRRPCPRTWSQGAAANDKNLAAWPGGARCPVRTQCLAFALRTRQVHGIWGGLT